MKESEFHLETHTANSKEVFNDQSQLEIKIDDINIITEQNNESIIESNDNTNVIENRDFLDDDSLRNWNANRNNVTARKKKAATSINQSILSEDDNKNEDLNDNEYHKYLKHNISSPWCFKHC